MFRTSKCIKTKLGQGRARAEEGAGAQRSLCSDKHQGDQECQTPRAVSSKGEMDRSLGVEAGS